MVLTRRAAASASSTAPPEAIVAPTAASVHYEFGGPLGALGVMLLLPIVVVVLYFGCGASTCIAGWPSSMEHVRAALDAARATPLWDWKATGVVFGWSITQALLYVVLPGPKTYGVLLRNGSRLRYPMNGHLAFWLSLLALKLLPYTGGSLVYLYDHYLQLATASMALSVLLSVLSFAASFVPGCELAEGGDTGNRLYDFFIGRALNPRVGALDLKAMCELRPGLIGWVVLNLGMAAAQFERIGHVSWPMICVVAFQAVYVWDALYHEQAILTTMDITTDGFGFMLAFGDMTWVPFTYSLQARLLVDHDPLLPPLALACITLLNCVGYFVFRGANSQKDAFRRDSTDPDVSHLQWMQTTRGSKLLVSGWWGLARKINYTGDWLMGLSWSLCCGAISPIAYFYPVYFGVLLTHRAARDDHFCRLKYGDDWQEYKRRVPYIFVPGVI
uniref:Delta(14)-sterol reductase n=1 Tax=Calcidiscus leptoporus TaxID=127549 RepID=A0A7S0NZH8_9EUKA|mmetsp:Transcript_44095/g.103155  ORF Transcript_44095/g.103155 Transcript_44095/m.103155 type:complete len:445 (+) Transcript_44095:70-1404(+)